MPAILTIGLGVVASGTVISLVHVASSTPVTSVGSPHGFAGFSANSTT